MDIATCRIHQNDGTWRTSGLHQLKVGHRFKVSTNIAVDELPINIETTWELDGADFVYTVSSLKKEETP